MPGQPFVGKILGQRNFDCILLLCEKSVIVSPIAVNKIFGYYTSKEPISQFSTAKKI